MKTISSICSLNTIIPPNTLYEGISGGGEQAWRGPALGEGLLCACFRLSRASYPAAPGGGSTKRRRLIPGAGRGAGPEAVVPEPGGVAWPGEGSEVAAGPGLRTLVAVGWASLSCRSGALWRRYCERPLPCRRWAPSRSRGASRCCSPTRAFCCRAPPCALAWTRPATCSWCGAACSRARRCRAPSWASFPTPPTRPATRRTCRRCTGRPCDPRGSCGRRGLRLRPRAGPGRIWLRGPGVPRLASSLRSLVLLPTSHVSNGDDCCFG